MLLKAEGEIIKNRSSWEEQRHSIEKYKPIWGDPRGLIKINTIISALAVTLSYWGIPLVDPPKKVRQHRKLWGQKVGWRMQCESGGGKQKISGINEDIWHLWSQVLGMLSTHKKIENYSYINGYPLQCSHLENPMNRGAWWATVHGVTTSRTWLSNQYFHIKCDLVCPCIREWTGESACSSQQKALGSILVWPRIRKI